MDLMKQTVIASVYLMGGNVTKVTSETLVDPSVAPPIASDQVAKPFVSEFVRDESRCVVFH